MSGSADEIRDRADSGSAVPHPQSNFVAVLRRTFLRRYVDGKCCVVSLDLKYNLLAVTGGDDFGYIPV